MARAELANPTSRPPANPGGLHPKVVRELALSLPDVQERELAGHPAFWGERVFAILWPQERWVHLPLTVEMQQELIARAPISTGVAPMRVEHRLSELISSCSIKFAFLTLNPRAQLLRQALHLLQNQIICPINHHVTAPEVEPNYIV